MGNGHRSERPRSGRHRVVPWLASILLHAGLIVIGLIVTWSVIRTESRRPPRPIVADFQATAFLPVDELPDVETTAPADVPSELEPPEPVEFTLPEDVDTVSALFEASRAGQFNVQERETSFAGVRMTNARSIVYVIDASGSMTTWLPLVLRALRRSLDRLDAAQRYAVFFFQGGDVVAVPPAGRLQPATPRAINETMAWTSRGANLIPGRGSDPTAALEAALQMEPDVIFLLSEGLAGAGASTIDETRLMERLDELNPIADAVTGNRWTRIQCIQVGGEQDETTGERTVMRRIADRHGGPEAWTFLGRSDLDEDQGGDQ
ncbi:MAG: VWA domain-containing protein [Phycisphaerales bacterium]|nr:VWA domain-containing protein [Phycisphaerales bacterium]